MTSLKNYVSPNAKNWSGRTSAPDLAPQYWYQQVQLLDLKEGLQFEESSQKKVALLGYACQEGVKRNQGRVGAKESPQAIRKQLGKLAWHVKEQSVFDLGDFCSQKLEEAQAQLSGTVQELLSKGVFPLVLGGGHDIAYGNGHGILQFLRAQHPDKKLGIINFDAHFDLRPVSPQPTSGTPFYQLLHEFENVGYFALGIQEAANPPELFAIAEATRTQYLSIDKFDLHNWKTIAGMLALFCQAHDYLYITIDLDGFSSAYAPGVSAPSPLGFAPPIVWRTLESLMATQKVVLCDIAELNPSYDTDDHTARLAARLVEYLVRCV